jgi:hypothetical protein
VTDYQTAGPNRLSFVRSYNSLANAGPAATASVLGVNWRSNYDGRLRIASASSVSAERADGRILDFTLTGGTWRPDSDVELTLTQAGSGWTLTDGGDTVAIGPFALRFSRDLW